MTFDQAQSPRLGQRTPIESTYVQIFDVDPETPTADLIEAAWPGMLIFRLDLGILQVYNGDESAWQDVAGGVAGQLTYIAAEPPDAHAVGDLWLDSDDGNHPYYASTTGTTGWISTIGPPGPPGEPGPQGSQGVPGPPGPDGQQLYTWVKYADTPTTGMNDLPAGKAYLGLAYNKTSATESSTYGDYQWSLVLGPPGVQGVAGPAGADGQPTYTWVKYADSPTTGMNDLPAGKAYIGLAYNKTTPVETTNYADYAWSLILGPQGPAGSQGIQGPPGSNGQSLYTWLKYADTPTTGMSDLPAGKTYMGVAYNKTSSTESSTYGDYEWSLIQGPQGNTGIQGPPGPDGQPTYTWVKYADTPTTGMNDLPAGKPYIGFAYNKTTATETTNYGDYAWSLILGPQGSQGIQGPAGANGQPTYTWLKYADTPTTGMNDDPTGKVYMGLAYNKLSATESSVYADYSWSLIQGPQGGQGVQGPAGPNGQPTYTWIKYGTSLLGAGFSDSSVGKTHLGIAYNKTTATESETPGDYEWSLIQGPQGPQGPQGDPGAPPTDGNPPASSPVPDAIGGVGVVHVRWTAITNADPVTYDVHISDVDDFTPVVGTKALSTESTAATIKALPDGSPLQYGDETTPVVYYVKIVARDADPGFAPASAQDSTTLYRVSNTEISSEFAYIGTLSATQITTGILDAEVILAGVVQTATEGQRVMMDPAGVHLFDSTGQPIVDLPTDPTKIAEFKGKATMTDLTVTTGLSIQTAGVVASGASLELVGSVAAPSQGPSVVVDHEVITGTNGVTLGYTYITSGTKPTVMYLRGNAAADTDWWFETECSPIQSGFSRHNLTKQSLTTGGSLGAQRYNLVDLSSGDWVYCYGLINDGTALWMLMNKSSSGKFVLRKYSYTGLYQNVEWDTTTPYSSYFAKGLGYEPTIPGWAYVGFVNRTSPYNWSVNRFNLSTGAVEFGGALQSGGWVAADEPTVMPGNFQVGYFDYGDGILRGVFNCNNKAFVVSLNTSPHSNGSHRVQDDFLFGTDGGVGASYNTFSWIGGTTNEFRQLPSQHTVGGAGASLIMYVPWKKLTGLGRSSASLDATYDASYTWRDSNAAGIGGTSETTESKRTKFTAAKRSRIRLSVPLSVPGTGGVDDPNAVSFYVGPHVTPPP